MNNQSFLRPMRSGLLNLNRDAEHGDKQEQTEECIDVFHLSGEVSADVFNTSLDYSDIM